MDAIYDVAAKNDHKVRTILDRAVRTFTLAPVKDEDIRGMAFKASSAHEIFTKLLSNYEGQISEHFASAIAEYYGVLLEGKIERDDEDDKNKGKRPDRESPEVTTLSSSEINAIIKAHAAFATGPRLSNVRIAKIEKGAIDDALMKVSAAEAES